MLSLVDLNNYYLNLFSFPPLVVGFVGLFFGIYIFLQNKKSLIHFTFLLICFSVSFWLVGVSLVYASRLPELALFWYRSVAFFGVVNIAPTIYLFSSVWVKSFQTSQKQRTIVFLGYPIFFGFYLLGLFSPLLLPSVRRYFWGFYPQYGNLSWIYLAFFFFYFLGALYNFTRGLLLANETLQLKRARAIAIAFFISISASFDYVAKLFDFPLYPFGYLPVLCWILIVSYSILKYRLLDIRTVIHKTIMWGVTSLVFAVPVVLFSYLGKNWLVRLHPAWFSAIVFGLAILFILYARLVQPRIDHLFQRRRWDLARVLENFTDELVHLRELDELSRHIVETIRSVFYVREISLLLSKDETGDFECVSSLPEGKTFHFDRNHTFLHWLEKIDVLVLREYLDVDPKYHSIQEAAKAYFEVVNSQLCVPLVVSQRLLGVINIGEKANLKRFGTAEINFLSDLRKTAAIALSNSLRSIAMQESLRRWNVELEKKVEERTRELKETQTQLIQAEKLATIGTLAGGVAHEINNPLTAVLTNVQMLKMSSRVEDPEALSLIEEGAKRCREIIQKLMRYARKTEETESYEPVDVNKVIHAVADFLGYQLKQENIELHLALGKLDPIAGIANELEQVFTNLILNARDAIKAVNRRGKIEIKTEQKNGAIKIDVIDNGIGIKKEHWARIFDPFYTTKDVGEGTGLGLTVSSGIVEKHLGKISVSSEVGQGTTFTIQFPIAKEKQSELLANK